MAKHAFLSASASHRWINCPPSAKLCEGIKDESSHYAQEGTDCHELCAYLVEMALGRDVEDPTENLTYYSGEMQNCAEEYRDYVLEQFERSKKFCSDPMVFIEQRLDFSRWVENGFGTGDCVIIADEVLHIIDYKHGLGVLVESEGTKVITGVNTRRSYANVWDPKSINGAAPKYSVSLIIPKSDTVTVNKIKAAIQAAYEEGESKLKGTAKVCPALDVIKTPLRDGDKERPGDEAYKDSYFINANSATAPGIVDADRQQIIDRSEVYSGVYGRASINLYAFTSNGNRGIACGLNNLQKIRDGEPLGGKSRTEDDFATEEDDDFLS